ncbi:MAG: DNRLRE domain-containing protein [Pseudomonadota bacterium]
MRRNVVALLIAAVGVSAHAQTTVEIAPTRDNTLYEDSNGALSNGAGSHIFVGRIQSGGLRRAVLAFDDLSAIPEGAEIVDASITLQMNRSIVGDVRITAHPLTASWGEGDSNASNQEGGGADSASGDATWIHRSFDTETWSAPGGDFDSAAVAVNDAVGSVGTYSWQSDGLADLVAGWRSGAAANNGLIFIGEAGMATTAKRFSSREGANPPVLTVTFLDPEGPPPVIVRLSGLWADPSLLGEGFNIIESSAGITVYYFGYASNGERLWLISETLPVEAAVEQTLSFTLFLGAGGTFDAPESGPPIEWGRLELTPLGCTAARFELMGTDGSKVSNADLLASISGVTCDDSATR